jgi:hypothetical protein
MFARIGIMKAYAAETWFEEYDPESVAFEYEVMEQPETANGPARGLSSGDTDRCGRR